MSSQISLNSLSTELPRITVITPSFNQGQYLEETIRSVVLQDYPNLDYFVIDGGSTDNSIDIIRKYEPWITWWVSEPDRGQAHAINKGFERCTGDLVGWINSDDMLLPGSLHRLADAHTKKTDCILLGDVVHLDQTTKKTYLVNQKKITFNEVALMPCSDAVWQQPGTFVPSKLFLEKTIFLDETYRYVFDHDWICRLLRESCVIYLHEPVAIFREHQTSKTVSEGEQWFPEMLSLIQRYWDSVPGINKHAVMAKFELFKATSLLHRKIEKNKAGEFLKNAVRIYPKIVISKRFFKSFVRWLL